MNNNIQEYDDEPDNLYDDTALRREDETDAYIKAQARELDKQLDAALEAIRLSKDARTLREWATEELAKKYEITPALAAEIVADDVAGWTRAFIPFDWNRPIQKASRFMQAQALYSTQQQYQEWKYTGRLP